MQVGDIEMRVDELSYIGRREVEGLFIPKTRGLKCLLADAKEVAQDADSPLRNDESRGVCQNRRCWKIPKNLLEKACKSSKAAAFESRVKAAEKLEGAKGNSFREGVIKL